MVLPGMGGYGVFGATAPAVVKAATAPTSWIGRAFQAALKQAPSVIKINYPSSPQGSPPILPPTFPPPRTQSKLPPIGGPAPQLPATRMGNGMTLILVAVVAMIVLRGR